MNGTHYVGAKALSVTEYEPLLPVTGVILWADDENCYQAGTESGTVIEADCPYATQQMANTLLAKMQGYQYRPVSAQGAIITPLAELGDGVNVNGTYTQMAYQKIRFSTGECADIAAPGNSETPHEYKAEGTTTRQFTRQLAQTRSEITKTAEEIRLSVSSEIDELESSFTIRLDSIESEIKGLDGQISEIDQRVDSIRLSVSNGSTSSFIELTVDGARVSSANIEMSGLVTYTGLASGTTTIDGGCIQTGTIDAQYLNLRNSISFSDFDYDLQDDYNLTVSRADESYDTVGAWTYTGTTYIDGEKIMAGTVMASYLLGGVVGLLDSSERQIGTITIERASSADKKILIESDGAIELVAYSGDVFISSDAGHVTLDAAESISVTNDLIPNHSGSFYLGNSSFYWLALYTRDTITNGSSIENTSDVSYGLSSYDAFFDALQPAMYTPADSTSGGKHLGIIAEDVEAAMATAGMTSADFAGVSKEEVTVAAVANNVEDSADDNATTTTKTVCGLRYNEFIALCIDQIQRLKARVAQLEANA